MNHAMLQTMVSIFQGSNLSHYFHMTERTYLPRRPCSDQNKNSSPCSLSNSCAWSCTSGPIQRVQNRPPFSTKLIPLLSGDSYDFLRRIWCWWWWRLLMMMVVVAIMVTVGGLMMLKLKKVTWLKTHRRKIGDESKMKSRWCPDEIQMISRWNPDEI